MQIYIYIYRFGHRTIYVYYVCYIYIYITYRVDDVSKWRSLWIRMWVDHSRGGL